MSFPSQGQALPSGFWPFLIGFVFVLGGLPWGWPFSLSLSLAPSCSGLALPCASWSFLGGLAFPSQGVGPSLSAFDPSFWGFGPSGSWPDPSFSRFGPGLLGVGNSSAWPFLLSGWPFSRFLGFSEWELPVRGLALPSFSAFGLSLSLTPKVFFLNHNFFKTRKKIKMLLLLTSVKVNSGIARDAFTQKVALSGINPTPSFSVLLSTRR